jgi:predicted RecB family nuclease
VATLISAAMLYNFIECPHRVTMDMSADANLKDKVSPFVQLLWDKGSLYESEIIGRLAIPFVDLSIYPGEEKELKTKEAMDEKQPLIYGGRIQSGDLFGEPDLLRYENGSYIAGDIKSGAGEHGGGDDESDSDTESKPKVHYAVQLAVYNDILKQLGRSTERRAFVWDIHGREVTYRFDELYGKRNPHTLWQDYSDAVSEVRTIVSGETQTLPAYSAVCKNCVWYTACIDRLTKSDDLTLIPRLGRSKRDVLGLLSAKRPRSKE